MSHADQAKRVAALFPAIIFVIVFAMGLQILPFYAGGVEYGYDPTYVYFFNGVSLADGFFSGYFDHPGTPLQLLIAAFTSTFWYILYLLGIFQSYDSAVLKDPEVFLQPLALLLLLGNCAGIFYLGVKIWHATKSILTTLIAQVSFLLFGPMLPKLGYVAPEALMTFSVIIIVACLSPYLFSHEAPQPSQRTATAIGVFLALGITSKPTFAPLVLLLLILPTWRMRVLAVAIMLLCVGLLLLPVLPHVPQMLNWFTGIVTHSGVYGEGAPQIIQLEAVPHRLYEFWRATPLIYAAIFASVGVALVSLPTFRNERVTGWQAGVLAAILIGGLGLAIKHFGIRYVVPVLAIAPVVLAWAIHRILLRVPDPCTKFIKIAAFAGIAVFAATRIHADVAEAATFRRTRDTTLALIDQTLVQYPGALVIGSYRVRTMHYGMQFGLAYVADKYADYLVGNRPDALSYNIWNQKIRRSGRWHELTYLNDLIAAGHNVLIVVEHSTRLPPEIKTEPVLKIPSAEEIYKVMRVETPHK